MYRCASGWLTHGRVRVAFAGLILLNLIVPPSPAAAQGVTEIIAMGTTAVPDDNGSLDTFSVLALNNAGQVAFKAKLMGTSGMTDDDEGIYLADVGSLTQIARERPFSTLFTGLTDLGNPVLNDAGQVAFKATLLQTFSGTPRNAVYRGTGGVLTTIAFEGDAAPDVNGVYSSFGPPALNASGQAAFSASLTNTSEDRGLFRGDGGAVTQIARAGQAAPDGNGVFSDFSNIPSLNASGQAAFSASLTDTSEDRGIFRGDGGTLTQIARKGQAAPDGNGVFSDMFHDSLNASGQSAFFAFLTSPIGGFSDSGIIRDDDGALTQIARTGQAAPDGNGVFSVVGLIGRNGAGQTAFSASLTSTSDDTGIFRDDSGTLIQIARAGQAAPDGNGMFSSFGSFALNASGQVAFIGHLTGTSGGTDDDEGVFLANGIDILQVAREGDVLAAPYTITSFQRVDVNDAGQLAFQVDIAFPNEMNEAIVRFTIDTEVHWIGSGSGFWTSNTNWTDGVEPNSFHDTFIQPDISLTVTAPTTNKTVESLTLGGGAGTATLRLDGVSTGDLRALEASTIESTGVLLLTNGRTFSAPALDNHGMIRGDGTVDAPLGNFGEIEAIGQELVFSQLVTNNASTGLITGRDVIFRFDGSLTNHSALALSFGTSDIFGDVNNETDGTIAVAGNSQVTFYDDVTNDGTLNVGGDSSAVFFGALTGNGNDGTGDVQALGDLLPGSSPGLMAFGGDLTLGPITNLEIELGGLAPGGEFDQLDVAGQASLTGTLDASLLGNFEPVLGDTFEILVAAGGVTGAFTHESFPDLGSPLIMDAYYDANTVTLAVVPALPGDYNADGAVNAADYTVWRNTLGQMGVGLPADGTGDDLLGIPDGVVDHFDYEFWKLHYGDTIGTGSTFAENSGSVPEPATWVLSAIGLLCYAQFRRRSRARRLTRSQCSAGDALAG